MESQTSVRFGRIRETGVMGGHGMCSRCRSAAPSRFTQTAVMTDSTAQKITMNTFMSSQGMNPRIIAKSSVMSMPKIPAQRNIVSRLPTN